MQKCLKYKNHHKKLSSGHFRVVNGLLVNDEAYREAQEYKAQERRLVENDKIGFIEPSSLPKIGVYGIPLAKLLSTELSQNRCHQSAIALSLAFPKSKIVFANLTKYGAYLFIEDINKEDDNAVTLASMQSSALNEQTPTFNHSYLIVDGKSLSESKLKAFNRKHTKQLKFNPDTNYVIDAQNGFVIEKSLYDIWMHPQILSEYDNLEKSSVWCTLQEQAKLRENYSTKDLTRVMSPKISKERNLDDYITASLQSDLYLFAVRPNPQQKLFQDYSFMQTFGLFR